MKILKGSLFKSSSRTNKHTEFDFGGFSELNVYNIISILSYLIKNRFKLQLLELQWCVFVHVIVGDFKSCFVSNCDTVD